MDDLFESAIEKGNLKVSKKNVDASFAYCGTQVITAYHQQPQLRRKRQNSDLVVEVEISANNSDFNATDIDTVINNGTLNVDISTTFPSTVDACR